MTKALEALLRFHESGGHEGDGSEANLAAAKLDLTALRSPSPTREAVLEEAGRLRAPQDATGWPPGLTGEQIEQRIDDICGCKGRWKCCCVATFNQANARAWAEHNTALSPNPEPIVGQSGEEG